MSTALKPIQRLVLWRLVVSGGMAWQEDLPLKLNPNDRNKLVQVDLIEIIKEKSPETGRQATKLVMTDRGWNWCSENMSGDFGKSPAGGVTLGLLLERLNKFLDEHQFSLAEVFWESPPPIEEPVPEDSAASVHGDAGLAGQIERAYYQISGGQANVRVLLADLRPHLNGSREEQDAALARMEREGILTLYSRNNPREITDADRAAAYRTQAGTENHLIYLGGPTA